MMVSGTPQPNTAGTATYNSFVDVRTASGKLLFTYDPQRDLVMWREGTRSELIDLRQYK